MSTGIEWTDETWNPTRGCSKVSAGCLNCYAMRQAHRFHAPGKPYAGLTHYVKGKGPQWTGQVRTVPEALDLPLRWRRPRRVFVDSMSDLFHPDVPFEFVDQVFAVMAWAPRHTFQVLTKRPERMAEYLNQPGIAGAWVAAACEMGLPWRWSPDQLAEDRWPLPNVWLGTSVEDQPAAHGRIPHLLRCPAAVRFLSCEPLLAAVRITQICEVDALLFPLAGEFTCEGRNEPLPLRGGGIHWVIAGGESGPGARPCDVAWLLSLRDQCAAAGVPYFLKQLGAQPYESSAPSVTDDPGISWVPRLRDPKGGDPSEWPSDLRVREFPQRLTELNHQPRVHTHESPSAPSGDA